MLSNSTATREADFDLSRSFLSPATPATLGRECSDYDVVLGSSIYDPAYYSSLFEDGQYSRRLRQDQNSGICDDGSTSSAEVPQVKVTTRRAFEAVDVGLPFGNQCSFAGGGEEIRAQARSVVLFGK
ncbi:hypothetical protein NC653_009982 [Populus alba x Populus x berolinensis]|uniref:Uncharacterized protein n=1 Tax=Populus alba x Populus x berolinensis TaxID=444605 RepID=A0AAD6RAF6_9ROSI|nr:hypothetical protein NC653_009982 [Populus alba x Populus x berolinensis]